MNKAGFERFHYATLEELQADIDRLGVDILLSENLDVMKRPVTIIRGKTAPNSIAILPMEGCDSNPDGSPGELTLRRYGRLARGGAGLIWVEACAILPSAKANPLQMQLNRENVGKFADMLRMIRREAAQSMGDGHVPVCILQLTHSGRYSKPEGVAAPVIGHHDPWLDNRAEVAPGQEPIRDEALEALQEDYVRAALLAKEAGFDGVDIKACHRYLVNELLAGFTRRDSRYGGSFENRTRFLLETVKKVKKAVGDDFILACRLNVFDAHPYPYGWGVSRENTDLRKIYTSDMTEPLRLVSLLEEAGVNLLSNSGGNPYYLNPEVTRPLDYSLVGFPTPAEHPLESTARLFALTRMVQAQAPKIVVIGNGYSWLRRYSCYAGAANLEHGFAGMMGFGRMAFAYPDAARDILLKGKLFPEKECIACSKCTQIMRDLGVRTGCVIRDFRYYGPIYREGRRRFESQACDNTK